MFQIRRREFVCSLGALTGATVLPRATRAQEPGRIYRLGDLHLSPRNAPWNVALFSAVKADGFIDGQNLLVDEHGFGLNVAQLSEHAATAVKAKVDVIIAGGDPNVRAAQQATKEIPILGIAEDMVGSHFAASLAKPGGNTTGVSLLSSDLDGKRQEILMEVLPGARAGGNNTRTGRRVIHLPGVKVRGVCQRNRRGKEFRRGSTQRAGIGAALQ